ncbi:uncharacterized protein F5147DRAFT_720012 [Suillus discolor]|uniref:Uncharacterized protein n=1 Tax=Suillus discolor TaxID=1912936 RepID=A0A9P7EVZ6_9AGAM|nr:uncharacterized protein F5147DRAFT_720012 [Suillus discolor]KAG2094254.1 hypothetical protein F5147DRAFT_720012 [Suillus discolor]
MAWSDLMISYPTNSFVADVDLECLTALEARMFEDSEAGPAGNQQWGLDAGQHHRRWNMYLGPSEFLMNGFLEKIIARVNLNAAPYSVITLMLHLWSLQTSYLKL